MNIANNITSLHILLYTEKRINFHIL